MNKATYFMCSYFKAKAAMNDSQYLISTQEIQL